MPIFWRKLLILEKPEHQNLQTFRILCSELPGRGKVAGGAPSHNTEDRKEAGDLLAVW